MRFYISHPIFESNTSLKNIEYTDNKPFALDEKIQNAFLVTTVMTLDFNRIGPCGRERSKFHM